MEAEARKGEKDLLSDLNNFKMVLERDALPEFDREKEIHSRKIRTNKHRTIDMNESQAVS